jgi:serine/threonine-protein kinase
MMTTTHRTIIPKLTDNGGCRPATRADLPATLLTEQVERLAIAAAVAGALWLYGLVMDGLVRPATLHIVTPASTPIIEISLMVVAVAMFVYVKFVPRPACRKTYAGLAFFVVNAIGVALLNTWTSPPGTEYARQLSWNAVVILIASMIIPASPVQMLVASLVAATTDPLAAIWVGYLRGHAMASPIETMVLFTPNYACAMVAMVPSQALQRVGRKLRHAQEMGSYRLVELLGRGGMGEVWRAKHRLLARSAAIKLVRPELLGASTAAETAGMLRRFEREAQATAALSSPHTIRLFDYGVTHDQTFYYVMELLDGRDLETLVREFGPVEAGRAVYLLEQVCHSLAEAHARGLVHRDITPANIYACRLGLDFDFVKVLDFGLVTKGRRHKSDDTMVTGAHKTTGTPAFMAPEIILEGEVDQRADVYALGCVAYYLLTGQLVFDADTPMKMFVQHLQSAPIPPSQRAELPVPRDLEDLVMSALEKDPARRPQSAAEFLARMRETRAHNGWTNDKARAWWDIHLVELAEPELVVA